MAHVNYIDWHTHPFRADRWLEAWRPALDRALAFGASSCYLTRSIDDPLMFRQVSVWDSKDDFENYWGSDEITALRGEALNYFNKPLLPEWHSITVEANADDEPESAGATPERASAS
jgi:heme-degrading monooxygenase HmoA